RCRVFGFPTIAKIRFVQHQGEWPGAQLARDALLQLDGLRERCRAATVRDQNVSGSAAEMRRIELGQIVFARKVPQHQRDGLRSDGDVLAIDLDADGGEIALVENAINEAAHQAGFADAKLAHHADLLLQHYGTPITRNEALRSFSRSS